MLAIYDVDDPPLSPVPLMINHHLPEEWMEKEIKMSVRESQNGKCAMLLLFLLNSVNRLR